MYKRQELASLKKENTSLARKLQKENEQVRTQQLVIDVLEKKGKEMATEAKRAAQLQKQLQLYRMQLAQRSDGFYFYQMPDAPSGLGWVCASGPGLAPSGHDFENDPRIVRDGNGRSIFLTTHERSLARTIGAPL